MELIDITDELLSGRLSSDSVSYLPEMLAKQHRSINHIIVAEQRRIDELAETAETEAEESEDTVMDEVDEYLPSILDCEDVEQIKTIKRFREDGDDETEIIEESHKLDEIDDDLIERVRSNTKVQWVVSRMRPEQLTREVLEKLLATIS